jgi:RNA polymerase sigma factor (sigma-70 family)
MAVADDDPAGDAIQRLAFEQVLRTARSTLDEASNRALRLRFGLDGDEPMSYEEIAAQLGLSRETTRTMIARALARLRGLMTEDQWPPLTG